MRSRRPSILSSSRCRSASAVVAVVVVFGLSGCRSSADDQVTPTPRQVSESLIRSTVSDQLDLGPLAPSCPEVQPVGVGATWECTATTEDQRLVALNGQVDGEGRVRVVTTNVISAAALPGFERVAAETLNADFGSSLTVDDIDCGDRSVVFGEDRSMVCGLFDPDTQQIYDATLTVFDIETRRFEIAVAAEPRP
jgi:hypothetical protein